MDELTPSLAAEIETVKSIYAAINRNDVPAAGNFFDPQIEWIEPDHYHGGGGRYQGHADVMAKISDGRNSWAEGSCHLEGFAVAGDKVVVFVHALVRLHEHTDWIDGRFADVWTLRNGKAIQGRSFGERHEALEWAGAKASAIK